MCGVSRTSPRPHPSSKKVPCSPFITPSPRHLSHCSRNSPPPQPPAGLAATHSNGIRLRRRNAPRHAAERPVNGHEYRHIKARSRCRPRQLPSHLDLARRVLRPPAPGIRLRALLGRRQLRREGDVHIISGEERRVVSAPRRAPSASPWRRQHNNMGRARNKDAGPSVAHGTGVFVAAGRRRGSTRSAGPWTL